MEKKRNIAKSAWKRAAALLCAVILCFSDFTTASSFLEGSRVIAAEAESAAESDQPSEAESSAESEQPSESESSAESGQPSESESSTESERPSESESATESEQPSESESSTESEQPSESESSTESEQPSESESSTEDTTEPTVTAPAEPVLKSASSSSYNSITVKWNSVSEAQGYRVYRKVSGTSWKRIAEIEGENVSWKDTGLTCGTTYTYTVRAYVKDGESYLLSTYDQSGLSAVPVPSAPELKHTSSETSSVSLEWGKVSGATAYRIYRKIPGESWNRLDTVKNNITSYTDKTAKKSVKYIYTVKAMHNSVNGKYNKSGIQGAVLLPAATLKSVYISSKGNSKIQWSKQSGAEGYFVYRKEDGKSWSRVGNVSSKTTSFAEKELAADKNYCYTVAGYMNLNGKKVKGNHDKSGLAPKLDYAGRFVRNVTKTYLGTSGAGRKMYSYTIGTGQNHIVMTMAIHAWEDAWSKDGATLVKTGEQLIRYAAGKVSVLNAKKYSIIIVPMANPDGLYSGTTCNGPGRCSTYRYNSKGKLVKGGVDLNRCFPAGFSAQYSKRNYTGEKSLMAKEAVVLKKYIDSNKGNGKNIFIDAHGWYNQTITRYKGKGSVYTAFKKYFSGTRPASYGKGMGYISGYANSVGYESVLFEFPSVSSASQFDKKEYADKFIKSIFYMVNNIV